MATKHKCQLGAALTAVALAATLLAAGAGSTAVLAQTGSLQAPSSGLRAAPRTGMGADNTPAAPLASPVAAPLTLPIAQRGIVPASGTAAVRIGTSPAVAKTYVVKAHVVQGAALNTTQKQDTALAALAELARQAKEQQDKESEEKIALLQKTLSMGNSVTLSLLNPKSPIGNATLSVGMADSVDFERNQVSFNPGSLKQYGNLIGWPAANCHFKVPEDGFYMVAFAVENAPNVGGTTTVTAGISRSGAWGPQNEAKATLNKGLSVVAVAQEFRKGEDASSRITSGDIFAFNACEISRIK